MRLRALIAFAALLSLAVPAIATAKSAEHKHQHLFHLDVNLPDSNGYSMDLKAEDHRHVELKAGRGHVAVRYSVLGRASSHRVDADFGALGEVHIRIHLKPELVVPLFGKKRCGERIGFYGGRFRGKVDFTGEPEVGGVHIHRGRISLIHISHACKRTHRRLAANGLSRSVKGEARPGEEADRLSAELKTEGRTLSFEALRFKGSRRDPRATATFIRADLTETLGRVAIERTAFELTPEKVLRVSGRDKQPETAVIAPPKPFTGSASYSVAPETAPSWSGDLSVYLPGAGTVPLTGTGFSTEFCRAFSAPEAKRCLGPPEESSLIVVP